MGTSVGTSVFNAHGWRAAAALSVGWHGFCLLMILVRGPHCKRYTWFGYDGGYSVKKPTAHKADDPNQDKEKQAQEPESNRPAPKDGEAQRTVDEKEKESGLS